MQSASAGLRVPSVPGSLNYLKARASLAVGLHAEALDALRRVRRGGGGADRALVALDESEALFGLLRHREALGVASRALRCTGLDRDAAARLRIVRGHALWMVGRLARGRSDVEKAEREASSPLARARAHEVLALFAWKEQDLARARSHVASAWRLYSESGCTQGLVRTLEKEGGVLRDAGRLAEALRVHTRRIEIASTTTRLDSIAEARTDRGDLLACLGRWQEARADLDAAALLYRRLSDAREFTLVARSRAMLDLASGDLGAVRAVVDRYREAAREDRSNPRLLAEQLLLLSDLELAAGAGEHADRAAAEALSLFAVVGDREGECRSRVRRCHALLALRRGADAVREARRGLRIAAALRPDLRVLAELALGRSLLLTERRAQALACFERALSQAPEHHGLGHVARLGRALCRGAGRGDGEVTRALAGLERWGERRILSYCLADLRLLLGEAQPDGPAPARATAAEPPCASAKAMIDAALAMADEEAWPSRWAAAMRAFRRVLPWWRAAWVSADSFELRADLSSPARLAPDDLARPLAAETRQASAVDLLATPALREHRVRVLHRLGAAAVAPVAPGHALYLDTREGDPPVSGRQLALVEELARLLSSHVPALEAAGPRDAELADSRFPEIVGGCPAMERLFDEMARVAASSVPVHVTGETGTGKEKVAQALHRRSARRGPFVAINASSLSDDLFESELFGHVKGSFTGAVGDREGYVAYAEGGTLFVDEVAELSPRAQAKLLRFVQEREYRRVGENAVRRANVRIVTAANVDLARRVAAGLFRADLMYRLSVVTLKLPPLRERGDDLIALARHFLRAAAAREGMSPPALPPAVVSELRRYAWPGNVRELDNQISRAVLLAGKGPLRPEHFSPGLFGAVAPPSAIGTLKDARAGFERGFITRALERNGGSRVATSLDLGLTRQALLKKMRRLGIS